MMTLCCLLRLPHPRLTGFLLCSQDRFVSAVSAPVCRVGRAQDFLSAFQQILGLFLKLRSLLLYLLGSQHRIVKLLSQHGIIISQTRVHTRPAYRGKVSWRKMGHIHLISPATLKNLTLKLYFVRTLDVLSASHC